MTAFRGLAIGIAVAAIWDPAIGVHRKERPPIDLAMFVSPAHTSVAAETTQALERDLGGVGFRVNSGQPPAARVVVADRVPDETSRDVPIWAVDVAAREGKNIHISEVLTTAVRAPGQGQVGDA